MHPLAIKTMYVTLFSTFYNFCTILPLKTLMNALQENYKISASL